MFDEAAYVVSLDFLLEILLYFRKKINKIFDLPFFISIKFYYAQFIYSYKKKINLETHTFLFINKSKNIIIKN